MDYICTYKNNEENTFRYCFQQDGFLLILKTFGNTNVCSLKIWHGTNLEDVSSYWNMEKCDPDDLRIQQASQKILSITRWTRQLRF